MLFYHLLTFTIAITSFASRKVLSQNIPTIACPNIFQYLNYGNNYAGKITLNGAPVSSIKVEAQFAQREPITTGYSGRISLMDSLPATQSNLERGQPILYRVDFPNPLVLPKLTRIRVNEQTICSDYGLPPPNTVFTIHHIFYPSSTTFSRPMQPNHIMNNPFDENFIYNIGKNLGDFYEPTTNQITRSFDTQPFQIIPATQPRNPFLGNSRPLRPPTPQQPPTPPQPMQNPNNINTAVLMQPAAPTPTPRPKPTPNSATTCGQEGSSLTPFIVGGNEFERGRFPWLTAVYVRQSADLRFVCGGSLISTRTVLTAAHCFLDAQVTAARIVVYLGRHNLYASETGVEQRDIQTLVKHPDFNASLMSDADLALLHMRAPVSFTQFIRPICLWFSAAALSNQVGFVAGWGADNSGLDFTAVPKVVEVDIVGEAECLRSDDVFRTLTSTRSLCAGKRDGTGPCIGDSGGGLMINSGGSWFLRAITSLGLTHSVNNRRGCDLSQYVVYCDLTKHTTWVRRNMLA